MIKPMLCTLRPEPFNNDDYLWEIKYDGIRGITTVVEGYPYSIQSRSGKDKTAMFPELHLETTVPAIVDGELVCYDNNGKPIFRGIQRRANRVNDIPRMSREYPATYEVFEILEVEEHSLYNTPLEERKDMLKQILVPSDNVRLAPYTEDGLSLYAEAQVNADHYHKTDEILGHKEGVVGKLKAGIYRPGSHDWTKVKTFALDEFVICGYTQGTGWRTSTFGALVLGKLTHDNLSTPTHVGHVGTGFDRPEIERLYQKMLPLADKCPFNIVPELATWIKPVIRVYIQYAEYTDDYKLRIPSYKGMIN